MSPTSPPPALQRVELLLSDEVYDSLRQLAEQEGMSFEDMLLHSLKLERYISDARRRKAQILVREPNGQINQLLGV